MKTIIGIMGEKGSGKETVGDLILKSFSDKRTARIRSSDILYETLKIWNLPSNRHNLQQTAIVMNHGFGVNTLSNAVKTRIDSLDANIIIFDGIRWDSDVELLRSFERNFLIYVIASPEVRFERTKQRKEKVGEGTVSFEQFMQEEKAETELRIPILGKGADYVLNNEKGLVEIEKEVEEILKSII